MKTKNAFVFPKVGIPFLFITRIVFAKPAGNVVAIPPPASITAATNMSFLPVIGSDGQALMVQLQCRSKAVATSSRKPDAKGAKMEFHDANS